MTVFFSSTLFSGEKSDINLTLRDDKETSLILSENEES